MVWGENLFFVFLLLPVWKTQNQPIFDDDFYCFVVDAGTRAVMFDKIQGIQGKVVGEGTHFKIPFIQVSSVVWIFFQHFFSKSELHD